MGQNISRARQEALAEKQRLVSLARHVLPGWTLQLSPERIVPTRDLLGALQRGQKLLYRCERPDCGAGLSRTWTVSCGPGTVIKHRAGLRTSSNAAIPSAAA